MLQLYFDTIYSIFNNEFSQDYLYIFYMTDLLQKLQSLNSDLHTFRPVVFRLSEEKSSEALRILLDNNHSIQIVDEIEYQLRELIKSLHPSIKITENDYPAKIEAHLNGIDRRKYGVWIYYPWLNKLIHSLDEEEFVEVRTNRNRYKITRNEQEKLAQKKIGIIGLSVGQSIALTLALERGCGEIRLADFDTAELSNLNRIRTGIHNLGLKKTVIAAREIAEIDPYIKVKVFNEGISKDNIDEFFIDQDGKLDILVEVCDGLDIKINSRYKARELGIPVVMDTNDRGMLDVERFDLEPERSILHGLADGLDPDNIKGLTNEQKIPYMLRMIDGANLSPRLKASMIEVEQSINTWPQLGSSVTLGGAITSDICRRILLDQFKDSGRYYVDLDQIIAENKSVIPEQTEIKNLNPHSDLNERDCRVLIQQYKAQNDLSEKTIEPSAKIIEKLKSAALKAPSAGNNQPWKWIIEKGVFYLFHDKKRSYAWGDFDEIGAKLSLGAAIENVSLTALKNQLDAHVNVYPLQGNEILVASIGFSPLDFQELSEEQSKKLELSDFLEARYTNRKLGFREALSQSFYNELKEVVEFTEGYKIQFSEESQLELLGEIISSCDRERLLHKQGHQEFFHEIRWSGEEAEQSGDGIDVELVDLTQSEKAGFIVARDWNAISLLEEWDKGRAFQKMSRKGVQAASSMALFTMSSYNKEAFVNMGRVVLRAWLVATKHQVAVHPMLSPVFFFNRLKYGDKAEMPERMFHELGKLFEQYKTCFNIEENRVEGFLIKLAKSPEPNGVTFRLPENKVFYNHA